mmetsp:Transcript_17020/g.51022  ORF Transcript_17020/g.51022 Transcript_17020/m.51022 type:complete len:335 (+) Transcript_17020:157-1161(+)
MTTAPHTQTHKRPGAPVRLPLVLQPCVRGVCRIPMTDERASIDHAAAHAVAQRSPGRAQSGHSRRRPAPDTYTKPADLTTRASGTRRGIWRHSPDATRAPGPPAPRAGSPVERGRRTPLPVEATPHAQHHAPAGGRGRAWVRTHPQHGDRAAWRPVRAASLHRHGLRRLDGSGRRAAAPRQAAQGGGHVGAEALAPAREAQEGGEARLLLRLRREARVDLIDVLPLLREGGGHRAGEAAVEQREGEDVAGRRERHDHDDRVRDQHHHVGRGSLDQLHVLLAGGAPLAPQLGQQREHLANIAAHELQPARAEGEGGLEGGEGEGELPRDAPRRDG